MSSTDELRGELASIAASLRAYLEWQVDCGSSGIPRRPREARTATTPAEMTIDAAAAAPAPRINVRADKPAPPAAPASVMAPITVGVPSSILRDPNPPSSLPDVPPPSVAPSSSVPFSIPSPDSKEMFGPPSGPLSSGGGAISVPPPIPPSIVKPRAMPVLQADVKSCVACGLHTTRTNTVFSRGNPEAKLVFVGEAPGADEDAQGIPFVGKAGQLLDKMIVAMGLNPATDVYVCNIIKCRPPGNRRPEPIEISTCIPYLHEQLAHVDPKVIVAMGNTAASALLGSKLGITKVRGAWKLYRGKYLVMPTFHPSYLLRPGPAQSEAKRQAWEDLQLVMKELGLAKPPKA